MLTPLTEAEQKQLLLSEVDAAEDSTATTNLDLWWRQYAGKEALADGLQYWYSRRALLDYLLGKARNAVNIKTGDDSINARERFLNLTTLRDNADAEILKLEDRARQTLGSTTPKSTLPDAYADRLLPGREF